MGFQLSFVRTVGKDREQNRLGTPMRIFECASATSGFPDGLKFLRRCEFPSLIRAHIPSRARVAAAMRSASSTQGGAAR